MITCKKCLTDKLEVEFPISSLTRNYPICKECVKLIAKEYRKKNAEKIKEREKIRKSSAQYLANRRERERERIKNDPEYKRKKYENGKKFSKEYRKKNAEKIKISKSSAQYLAKRRERERERIKNDPEYKRKKDESRKKSIAKDPEKYKEWYRKYYLANKERKNKRDCKRLLERMQEDPYLKCRRGVSKLIDLGLKRTGSSKQGHSCWKYLPYTPEELMDHLESQFNNPENLDSNDKIWMTRFNRGAYHLSKWDNNDSSTWVWNIDYIIPQSDLPYSSMEEINFQKCWALSNLRPLSAKQNVIDGAAKYRHKK